MGTGATNIANPLAHVYLDISGSTIGLGPGGNGFYSQGVLETAENPAADSCSAVCDDPEFDQDVKAAIQEVGIPPYDLLFGHPLGVNVWGMNCRQWTKKVLSVAKANYSARKMCPTCEK